MAPEQARGKPGPSSDLWAIGLMLYEALTGIHPYQIATLKQDDIFAIAQFDYGSIPSVVTTAKRMNRKILYPKVAIICDRALRKANSPAFPDVSSFANALREAIGFDPIIRNEATDDISKRKLILMTELATLPFYSIKRRQEIKKELNRMQSTEAELGINQNHLAQP